MEKIVAAFAFFLIKNNIDLILNMLKFDDLLFNEFQCRISLFGDSLLAKWQMRVQPYAWKSQPQNGGRDSTQVVSNSKDDHQIKVSYSNSFWFCATPLFSSLLVIPIGFKMVFRKSLVLNIMYFHVDFLFKLFDKFGEQKRLSENCQPVQVNQS